MKEDLRVIKTKENIESHFIMLLNEYAFKDITVKMIVSECKINRSTFYRHYEDKYALITKITDKILKKYKKSVQPKLVTVHPQNTKEITQYFIPIIDFFYDYKRILIPLGKNSLYIDLFENMFDFMNHTFLKEITSFYNINQNKMMIVSYYSNVICSNVLTTMRWWHLENQELSKEEILDILVPCVTKGVFNSMKELQS